MGRLCATPWKAASVRGFPKRQCRFSLGFIAQASHHHTIVVDVQGRMPEFLEGFHKPLAKTSSPS